MEKIMVLTGMKYHGFRPTYSTTMDLDYGTLPGAAEALQPNSLRTLKRLT
jgi:hypothetical protein